MSVIRTMLREDNLCPYQRIPNELNVGRVEPVRMSKENLKLLNDCGHRIISKTAIGDQTYIPFFGVTTRQENKVLSFEDNPTPAMVKRQRAIKKVSFIQKYEIDQSNQVRRTEDSNSKLV
ncbi:hypothetical protein TNCV_485211 [Trichonephila clavipes]|nr:hypothetical protein TNCV_485211 [Trichonephila clavipes]